MHDEMHVELQVALNFVISYLYNKLPRTRVHLYGEELERLLRLKFEGHWYPSNPVKGSAFRCLQLNSTEIDPSFEMAAISSGLDFVNDIKNNLPSELRMWVDPGEVSYAIGSPDGKSGSVNVLFRHPPSSEETGEQRTETVFYPGNHPPIVAPTQAPMTFNPHAKDFLPKTAPDGVFDSGDTQRSSWITTDGRFSYSQRPQRKLYTVDEFASTKFGSTKMRSHNRNLAPFQRMQPPIYPSQPGNEVFPPATMPYMHEQQQTPVDHFNFFQAPRERQPTSLTTSSFSDSSSSGSSTSSSPDHVKGQIARASNRAPMSPTSPWGENFTLPTAIYNPADAWSDKRVLPNASFPKDSFTFFSGFNRFAPYGAENGVSAPTSGSMILSTAK